MRPRFGLVWVRGNLLDLRPSGVGLCRAAGAAQSLREENGIQIAGIDCHRAVELDDSHIGLPLAQSQKAGNHQRDRVLGIQTEGRLVAAGGPIIVVQLQVGVIQARPTRRPEPWDRRKRAAPKRIRRSLPGDVQHCNSYTASARSWSGG